MKSKEELEIQFREALKRQRKNIENLGVKHPAMPPEQLARIQSEELPKLERAEGPDFEYEFSTYVAAACNTLVNALAGRYGSDANNIPSKIQEDVKSGYWDRSTLGGELGISAEELKDVMRNAPEGPFLNDRNKDVVIQALYEKAGFEGVLPTREEIEALDKMGLTFEAAFAKEISGKGSRHESITGGIFRQLAEKSNPRINEDVIKSIKTAVLGEKAVESDKVEDDRVE